MFVRCDTPQNLSAKAVLSVVLSIACCMSRAAHQFKYRDFRSRAEADGKPGAADSAVYVELLPAGFFEPSADVGSFQA